MNRPKRGYLVSKFAHRGSPLVIMGRKDGESAKDFAQRFHKTLNKAMCMRKNLQLCKICGKYKGQIRDDRENIKISCLCDGILCPKCGEIKIHRPISNSYEPADGIIHYPSFSGMVGCEKYRVKK